MRDAVAGNHAFLLFAVELICVYFIDIAFRNQSRLQFVYSLANVHIFSDIRIYPYPFE